MSIATHSFSNDLILNHRIQVSIIYLKGWLLNYKYVFPRVSSIYHHQRRAAVGKEEVEEKDKKEEIGL